MLQYTMLKLSGALVGVMLLFMATSHSPLQHSSRESSPPSHSSSPDVFAEMSPDDERHKTHAFDIHVPPPGRATWPLSRQPHHSDSPEHPETLSNEGSESTDADKLDDPSGSEGDQSSSCDMDEESEREIHTYVLVCCVSFGDLTVELLCALYILYLRMYSLQLLYILYVSIVVCVLYRASSNGAHVFLQRARCGSRPPNSARQGHRDGGRPMLHHPDGHVALYLLFNHKQICMPPSNCHFSSHLHRVSPLLPSHHLL